MYQICHANPAALAHIRGGNNHPTICGTAAFFPMHDGMIVAVVVRGLPEQTHTCTNGIFELHIHKGTDCTGTNFSNSGSHLDKTGCLHPRHTGDLPPLFSGHGKASAEFWTDRFTLRDILGKTIIIHKQPDDMHTQPSGNAGEKIACGKILPCCCR